MDLYMDDKPVAIEPKTLRRALEVAQAEAQAAGRIVIDVIGDGEPIAPELIETPPEDDGGVRELRVRSAAPGLFIRETLLEAADAIGGARADQDVAAEFIQAGELENAMAPIQKAMSVWDAVQAVLAQSQALIELDVDNVQVELEDGTRVIGRECVAELARHLGEVKRAMIDQDWSTLADELAYEMSRLVERWAALLHTLADGIPQEAG